MAKPEWIEVALKLRYHPEVLVPGGESRNEPETVQDLVDEIDRAVNASHFGGQVEFEIQDTVTVEVEYGAALAVLINILARCEVALDAYESDKLAVDVTNLINYAMTELPLGHPSLFVPYEEARAALDKAYGKGGDENDQ